MFREFLISFANNPPSTLKKTSNSPIFSYLETEDICKIGIVGLAGVWELYDMWI
jgi:hypothetical protein